MIFYNNQLMQSLNQVRLYVVSHPTPFARFQDHESAIIIQLHELIEQAIADNENPVALIEDSLGVTYTEGATVDELTNFIVCTDHMSVALQKLKENWHHLDPSVPADSLFYSTGISRSDIIETYAETTLRNYLEALASVYNHE
jgi:hypothetical protein